MTMRTLVAMLVVLAAAGGAAAEPVTFASPFDGLHDIASFDTVGENLSAARVAEYKMVYERLANARKIGQSGVCTLYAVEFACSRRRFADLKMPEEIAEKISSGLSRSEEHTSE